MAVIIGLSCLNTDISVAQETNRGIDISIFKSGNSLSKFIVEDSSYYLVLCENQEDAKQYLAKKTLIMRRLNSDSFIIQGKELKKNPIHTSLFKANDLWKLSNNILQNYGQGAQQKSLKNVYTLKLRYTPGSGVLDSIFSGIKICDVRNSTILIECSDEELRNKVLPISMVTYIGLESQQAKVESRVLDLNLAPNMITYLHHTLPDLQGAGVTVSIKEEFFNKDDIDLEGRYTDTGLQSNKVDVHATEMATLVGGEGNSFITGKGVAPHVQLASSSFALLGPDPMSSYTTNDITVQNHSYGTVIESMYGALAESFDEHVKAAPHILHVFSSGNDGELTSSTGLYVGIPGYANLTGNFKMSKNTLSVGSVDTLGRSISFSSKGPAYDGRIKPELVSYSTAGSSNSAALVSGVAVLLQQAYRQKFGSLPSVSLQKALLINGAQDLGNPGPDFKTGFGNLNAWQSMEMLQDEFFIENTVNEFESNVHQLIIPTNVRNLKVTLVWDDTPAQVNSTTALVNDLDLTIESPDAQRAYPWVLDSTPLLSALEKPASRGVDHLNNVEQVLIEQPAAGLYHITVEGGALAGTTQQYAIAYSWEEQNEFSWYYPTGSDNMPYNGEAGTYFQWKSTLATETGRLEVSVDQGNTWTLIKDNIDLSTGLLRWQAPLINTTAQVRMVVGTEVYTTDVFTISQAIIPSVGFYCQDSVLVKWNRVLGAEGYRVKYYNNSVMEEYLLTSDTSFVFREQEGLAKTYFAIEAMLTDNHPGIQGYAFDYTQQGISCYLTSFYTQLQSLEGINLLLEVGTTYGIERVVFQRQEDEEFVDINVQDFPTADIISFLDTSPFQGLNNYRVVLHFVNGEQLYSDVVSEYFLTKIPFAIFPNPVHAGDELQIIAKPFSSWPQIFTLYNGSGMKLFSYNLQSDRESIPLPSLQQGIYVYSIETEEGISRGKLIMTR